LNKEISYKIGLLIPDGEGYDVAACCGYKQPSLAEQELTAHEPMCEWREVVNGEEAERR
jgi:hypothetical protein